MTTLKENLDMLLSNDKIEQLGKVYGNFEKDQLLADKLQRFYNDQLVKDGLSTSLIQIIDILGEVVFRDYAMADPKVMAPIYHACIDGKQDFSLGQYKEILEDFNRLSKAQPSIVTFNVEPRTDQNNGPYSYKEGSFGNLIFNVMNMRENNRDHKYKPAELIKVFADHLVDLSADTDVEHLLKSGYASVMQAVYSRTYTDIDSTTAVLSQARNALKNLDKKGFDIYAPSTVQALVTIANNGQFQALEKTVEYGRKNTIILKTKILSKD